MKQCDLYKKSLTESPATLSTPRRSPIEAMPELVQSDLWLSSCHSLILRKYNIQYNSTQLEFVPRVECNLSAECSLNLFSNNNCSLLFLWPPQTHFTLDEILCRSHRPIKGKGKGIVSEKCLVSETAAELKTRGFIPVLCHSCIFGRKERIGKPDSGD